MASLGMSSSDTGPVLKIMEIILLFIDQLNFLISDIIVVWRAWIMFPYSSIARFALIASIIGTSAGVVVDTVMTTEEITQNIDYLVERPLRILICTLPVLATNLVSTLLMAYKTWY
ncbi:hypothetical protein K435DRAFT_476940 [Dendrothele bispora CBS 962.96]|uniref:Uncharacterized protein n=1 Tax=Dendrothele bispora (strain CBS 962.96) TaxID=1314807 RepID=A0A4S8KZB2_DENBC|nr:hypothetical protein K435DRAFT_476940 [Dendrothele bispora CBS 962.96]